MSPHGRSKPDSIGDDLFALLTLAGCSRSLAMKVQNFPDLDLPTVTVAPRCRGRAGQLETKWRARSRTRLPPAGRQAHLHQCRTVAPPSPPSSGWKTGAGGGGRCPLGRLARARRTARRPARSGDQQD